MKTKTDWDLTPLLKSEDETEITKELKTVEEANKQFSQKWKNNKEYLTNPEKLKEALDEFENIHKNFGLSGNPGLYYYLKFQINQSAPKIKAKFNRIEEFEKRMLNENLFFTLNLSKTPKEKQIELLKNTDLKNYKHFLERIFEKGKHTLTEPEEKIIAIKETTSHDQWERLTSSLISKQEREITIEGKKRTKNFSDLLNLVQEKNKETRDAAKDALNEILEKYAEVAEAEMNALMANKKSNDELKKFPRPDSARHLVDDVSAETVDTLIETVSKNFGIAHKFYELKTKLLKLPKLEYHERSVPYGETTKKYSFEEAVEIVKTAFKKIDKQFSGILEQYVAKSQIDIFPKKGKRNGAFCMHKLQIQPTYILLNFEGTLNDITTLAHETGHGINSELMKANLNALNIGTPKSTAEVASNFMEEVVTEDIIENTTDEEKLILLMEKLNQTMSSIFRQTSFYNFETELHKKFREKGYLSSEEIGELFKKHLGDYLGKSVDISESNNGWIYIPHFRYFFYVYSYVAGSLISKNLQKKVKQNPEFINKVKQFLSAGTSDSPENIFKNLGIDITDKKFWEEGLNEIDKMVEEAETLAKKLGKI